MSLAITHFTFGAAATMLVVTFLLPQIRYPRAVSVLGGIWAMIPDAHHVTPVFSALFKSLHDSAYVNLFWAHGLLDTLDPADTNEVALLSIALFLVATIMAETAAYSFGTPVQRTLRERTPGRTDDHSNGESAFDGAFADRESGSGFSGLPLVRAVRLVGGASAVLVGIGLHVLLFRASSHVGLLAGLGALLELQGAATLSEDAGVTSWTATYLPSGVRVAAKVVAVVAACLFALPLVLSLSTPTALSAANVALGVLLVLTAIRL